MQEIQRLHAGVSTYTTSSVGHWRNFIMYMSNFNVVVFQLDPFRHFATVQGPNDINDNESSGIIALAINKSGQLAMTSRKGMLQIFQLPNVESPIYCQSIDYKKRNEDIQIADRRTTKVFFELLEFHPNLQNVVCAYDGTNQECLFINFELDKVYKLKVPEKINTIGMFGSQQQGQNTMFLGTVLTGKMLYFSQLQEKLQEFYEKKSIAKKINYSSLEVDQQKYELQLERTVAEDTIPMTGFVHAKNINYSTVLSLSEDTQAQGVTHNIVSTWYQGYILVHDMLNVLQDNKKQQEGCKLTGFRQIKQARCSAFVADNPGLLVVGLSSGQLQFVNVTSIQTPKNQEYINYGSFFGHSADFINASLQNAMNTDYYLSSFSSDEIIADVIVSRGNPIISVRSFAFEGIQTQQPKGTVQSPLSVTEYSQTEFSKTGISSRKIIVYGTCVDGSFFIYDYSQQQFIYQSQPNHSESIFSLQAHPTFPNLYASISADTTCKVWKDTNYGLIVDQQFGSQGASRQYSQEKAVSGSFGNKSGGSLNTYHLLGPLLSGAWDPRPQSCFMMLSSFSGNVLIADIWRGSIFAQYKKHKSKVLDTAWSLNPRCLAATVSADGTGRIYCFDRNIDVTKNQDKFDVNINFMEFVTQTFSLNGVAFSPHDPLIAVACGDGYVRVYDLKLFEQTNDEILQYLEKEKIEHNFIQPIQIGKFNVSEKAVHKVTFHPVMKNVLGVTCDGGECRIYRYEWDGKMNFKVQTAAILIGHENNGRPIVFHPEIPYIVLTGSWDGTIRVWNWVKVKQEYIHHLGADVYGIAIQPSRPFEFLVGSRDLTIRKFYLKDLAQKFTSECIQQCMLNSVLTFKNGNSYGQMTNQDLKSQFDAKTLCPHTCDSIINGFAALINKPSYKLMKDQFDANPNYKQLSGDLSKNFLTDLNSREDSQKHNILYTLSTIISFFYPSDSGAKQLLNSLSFYAKDEFDFYVKSAIDDGDWAYSEFQETDGLALTGRGLQHFAECLGRHYIGNLLKSKQDFYSLPKEFSTQKFGFYNFQRKLPNMKSDAFRYQFMNGISLLIAAGNFQAAIEAFKYARCDDLVAYYSIFDPQSIDIAYSEVDKESVANRLNLEGSISPVYKRLIETQIIVQHSKNSDLIKQMCWILCQQSQFCLAKLIAHQNKETDIIIEVSWEIAYDLLRQKQPIRAALELLTVKQYENATKLLAISGEPFLAAQIAMTTPEESSPLGLFGMAEIAYYNNIEPDILLKIGRGNSVSSQPVDTMFLAKWFTFDKVIKYFNNMCNQLNVFKQNATEVSNFNEQQALAIVNIGQFFDYILKEQTPKTLLWQMNQVAGSLGQRYNTACLGLMDVVNMYVGNFIKTKSSVKAIQICNGIENYACELSTLYNLFRHRALDSKSTVCRTGACLSMYVGGIHAANLNFFNTAAFMLSQAEKIATKCPELITPYIDIEEIKLRKLLCIYAYQQGDNTKSKITILSKQYPKYESVDVEQWMHTIIQIGEKYDNHRDRAIFLAVGPSTMRCLFTPFDIRLQPVLSFCNTGLNNE
ncbi:WD40 repeat protein [Spironucleus salmonicida]|uniref:WD40 domain-containing protein n=1 Tax=Spironucleus salmonicida TaxID=348837 RepID=V6LNA6_9EUKA|nr:WD40 repeat protein [Spironucleus salmonicida]|eukprot:EST42204.1 WD40 domain-containing protein [Spironucleus salmonicida]